MKFIRFMAQLSNIYWYMDRILLWVSSILVILGSNLDFEMWLIGHLFSYFTIFCRYLALGIVGEHTIDSPMVSWEDPYMPYDVDNLGITALQVLQKYLILYNRIRSILILVRYIHICKFLILFRVLLFWLALIVDFT